MNNNNNNNHNQNKRVNLDLGTIELLQNPPNNTKIILSNIMYDSIYFIKKLELSIYITNHNKLLGDYSILVILLETNKGTVMMKYDEGYRGKDAFANAIEMLTQYNGLSSVINRALIELDNI